MPDMDGATILDVFTTGSQLSVYTRNQAGIEALSLFYISDPELRARIALVLKAGLDVHEAVAVAIE